MNLAVCALPEKKIRDTQLTAGAYEQIQLRQVTSVDLIRDPLFSYFVGWVSFVHQPPDCRAASIDYFGPATVVQSDGQYHSFVCRGTFGSPGNLATHILSKSARAANRLKLNILPVDLIQFKPKITTQHAHQRINLITRPLPVLCGKSVERKCLQPEARAGVNSSPYGLDTSAVSGNTWLPALGCPTSIAIHNNGHMTGQTVPRDRRKERFLPCSLFNYIGKIREHLLRSIARRPKLPGGVGILVVANIAVNGRRHS